MDYLAALLPHLENLGIWSYWIILALTFLESIPLIGLIAPGTAGLIFAGFLATNGNFDLGDMIWFAAIGGFFGDAVSYRLGKSAKFRNKLQSKFVVKIFHKTEIFFQDHGNKSIFLGRFVGPVRSFIPYLAGMMKMQQRNFYFWNLISSFVWAITYLLLGYIFGQAWQLALAWSTRVGLVILALVFLLFILAEIRWLVGRYGPTVAKFTTSLARSLGTALITNPDIKKFTTAHPKTLLFLANRLQVKTFVGLPLTILGLIIIHLGTTLLSLLISIITSDIIVDADIRIEKLLFYLRSSGTTNFFLWLTNLGSLTVITIWALTLTFLLILYRKKTYVLGVWVAILGSASFAWLGKLLIERTRPEHVAVYLENSFAWPSGHTTLATAFYGYLCYLAWKNLRSRKTALNIIIAVLGILFAVGFSRLYLGVHFTSDVLGGYLLGLIWLGLGIIVSELQLMKKKPTKTLLRNQIKQLWLITRTIISIICLFTAFVSTITYAAIHNARLKPAIEIESTTTVVENTVQPFLDHDLPQYTEDIIGEAAEPLSFIILADSDEKLQSAFQAAGWHSADPIKPTTLLQLASAAIRNESYVTAPMTPVFWNTEINNFNFQKPTPADTVRERHHARFWKTSIKTPAGLNVYIGIASFDTGLKWFITHSINPDIDTERETVLADLQRAAVIKNVQTVQFVEPLLGKNFSDDAFFTDGKLYLLILN